MCGIWGFIDLIGDKYLNVSDLLREFYKLKSRGPDRSSFVHLSNPINMYLGFHRLAIIDPHSVSDQPFVTEYGDRTIYTMCNGEIYNYRDLIKEYNLKPESKSDCAVIPLLYYKLGAEELVDTLDGEFACVIIDIDNSTGRFKVSMFRDNYGVRPMFYTCTNKHLAFSSTLAGLCHLVDPSKISQFPPDRLVMLNFSTKPSVELSFCSSIKRSVVYSHEDLTVASDSLENIHKNIRKLFKRSVVSMMHSDRPLGAFLSGGLDSSLVVSIAANHLRSVDNLTAQLNTFSIGLEGGTDEKYAKMVSEYCSTRHRHYTFTTEDFISAIPEVIKAIESYDVTTVRASVGQYLLSKKVAEETDVKVVLIGDGSDELTSGYLYFHNAPNPEESSKENDRLLNQIHYFDVLRADRGVASNGLEARVPFLDSSFVNYYLSLDPKLRVPIDGVEKHLLRSAFDGQGHLPNEVLWRKKEAFSDGVSSVDRSWHQIIQETVYQDISDEEFQSKCDKYTHCSPTSREALYYREIFDQLFRPESCTVIPHFWLPKWCGEMQEPSARALDIY